MFVQGDWMCAIDGAVPSTLRVGGGSALYVSGWLFHRRSPLRSLVLGLGDARHRVRVHSMPRLDVLNAHGHDGDQPALAAYRSGFWAVIPTGRVTDSQVAMLSLEASNEAGETWEQPLTGIRLDPRPPAALATTPAPGLIAICMATYNPDLDLFRRQIASIRAQTHERWRCFISDDLSRPDVFAAMKRELAGDDRFELHRNSERLGFYFNFERALGRALAEAEAVALADQDDEWYPDKLATLLEALRAGATLVYSDQRIVRPDGALVAPSYWIERENQWTDLRTLLLANTVTGAASLFRRDLLDVALPLPPQVGAAFHDHWIAAVALASGRISFVDRPLYDYIQHGGQVIGHAHARGRQPAGAGGPPAGRNPREQELLLPWQAFYFTNVVPQQVAATVLLQRCGDRLRDPERRMLARLATGDGTLGGVLEHVRAVRTGSGRRVDHHDREAIAGVAWRRWIQLRARTVGRPFADERHTVHPRADYVNYGPDRYPSTPKREADPMARLTLAIDPDAPVRVNVLLPPGPAPGSPEWDAAVGVVRALTAAGLHLRVVGSGQPPAPGVDVAALGAAELPVSAQDRWIAAGWRTAHAADDAARQLGRNGFVYLIGPQASHPFLAEASYRLPHRALFGGDAVGALFRARRLGVYATGRRDGDKASATFEIPIAGAPSARDTLEGRYPRRLVLAAPTADAAQLGVIALDGAIGRGIIDAAWELWAGPWSEGRRVGLAQGRALEPLASLSALEGGADAALVVGWAPPLERSAVELAAGGASVAVPLTDGFTAAQLTAVSSNLIPAEPTLEALSEALSAAVGRVEDIDARLAGAQVAWPRDWDQALPPKTVKRIVGLLDETA